jgi:hypothetical protein
MLHNRAVAATCSTDLRGRKHSGQKAETDKSTNTYCPYSEKVRTTIALGKVRSWANGLESFKSVVVLLRLQRLMMPWVHEHGECGAMASDS